MQAPTSYAGPRANEQKPRTDFSQTTSTNMAQKKGTVADLLAKKGTSIYSVRPDDIMLDAVNILKEKRIGALLVTSATGELEGILSERDITRKLSETPGQVLQQKVSALMTHKVQVCTPDSDLISTLRTMTDGRFRHMPVMQDGKLLGMVTIGDVVHYRLNELEHEAVQLKQMIVG